MKYIFPILICVMAACNKSGNDKNKQEPQMVAVEDSLTKEDEAVDSQSECKYKDGMYQATVEYYDPNKGESNSYKLKVEIADCAVIEIKFPDGEWLDKANVTSKELNEEGEVYIEGKDGRSYNVVIEK